MVKYHKRFYVFVWEIIERVDDYLRIYGSLSNISCNTSGNNNQRYVKYKQLSYK